MPTDIPITAADAITFSDATDIGWGVPRDVADTLSLSDTILFNAGIPQNTLSDQIILVDSITVLNVIGTTEAGFVLVTIDQAIGALGANVTVDIHIQSLAASPVALQFSLQYAATDLVLNSIAIGPAGVNAGKQLQSNGNNVIIFGLNQNVIADGILATASFTIPLTAVTNPTTLSIVNLIVVDLNGQPIASSTSDMITYGDAISLSDEIRVVLDLAVNLNDTLSLSDAIDVSGAGVLDIGISISDTLSFSDSILFTQSQQSGANFINYIRRYLNDVV